MSGCDFVSEPVVTAVSGSGVDNYHLCPSLTVAYVDSDCFMLYSVSDYTSSNIRNNQCRVYWTATGFTC